MSHLAAAFDLLSGGFVFEGGSLYVGVAGGTDLSSGGFLYLVGWRGWGHWLGTATYLASLDADSGGDAGDGGSGGGSGGAGGGSGGGGEGKRGRAHPDAQGEGRGHNQRARHI